MVIKVAVNELATIVVEVFGIDLMEELTAEGH